MGGIEPGEMPPISAWWPRLATKKTGSSELLNTGVITVKSGFLKINIYILKQKKSLLETNNMHFFAPIINITNIQKERICLFESGIAKNAFLGYFNGIKIK